MNKRNSLTIIISVIIILLTVGATLYYWGYNNTEDSNTNSTTTDIEIDLPNLETNLPESNTPMHYEFTEVEGETTVVFWPALRDVTDTLKIVIFSHGSNTTVTKSVDNPNVQDMVYYGEKFAKEGYIFAASNMYGANWGNEAAVSLITEIFNYIEEHSPYKTESTEKYLIGFSMGGLAVERWMFANGEELTKMALLAPTIYYSDWDEAAYKTASETTKIWHGDQDVNVPWFISETVVSRAEQAGYTIQFETIEGATHFDLDREYVDEIIEYFNQ